MTTDDDGLWVRSDVLPTGLYGASINVGNDRAWTLTPDQAFRYAATCVRRATEADHDAAVLAFTTTQLALPIETAASIISELRADRATDDTATEPLRFAPGVSQRNQRPFLAMHLDGKPVGQLTPARLRDHATGVLGVTVAADLDAALVRCLVGTIGTDENRARAMVHALGEHWPADDQT